MIYLNTYHYEKDRNKYRNNIEDLFATTVLTEDFDERDKRLINIIDNSTYVNENTIIGFNGCSVPIRDISRGLKTLLVIRWFIKHNKSNTAFDISSCGDNVLDELAKEAKNNDLRLLTCNYVTSSKEPVKILVNNKYLINSFSDLVFYGRKSV